MRLFKAEMIKLSSTRTGAILAVAAMIITLGLVVLTLNSGAVEEFGLEYTDVLSTSPFMAIFAIVFGVVAASTESRYRTDTPAFLLTPTRFPVLMSKLGACAVAAGIVGAITQGLALIIGLWWAGGDLPLTTTNYLELIASALNAMFATMFGVAIGFLIKNQAAAISIALIFTVVLSPLLEAKTEAFKYTFWGALSEVSATATFSSDWVMGMLVCLGWAVLFIVITIPVMRRRDVT